MNPEIGAGAHFSPDKKYRFALWRIWDLDKPLVMLIGLNPSVADEGSNDRTISRLAGRKGFISRHGYGGFYMTNLFPFISPYPEDLKKHDQYQAELDRNDELMQEINLHCETVIFCWGNYKTYGRDTKMIAAFPRAMCFGRNANGSPKHPLFLKGETKLRDF